MSSSAFLRCYDLLPRPGEFPPMWAQSGLGCVLWELNIGNMNSAGSVPDFISEEFPLEEQLPWWKTKDRGNLLKSIYFFNLKVEEFPHTPPSALGNYFSKRQRKQFEVSLFRMSKLNKWRILKNIICITQMHTGILVKVHKLLSHYFQVDLILSGKEASWAPWMTTAQGFADS